MPVRGADVVAKNIKSFGDGFIGHVNKTMKAVQNILDTKVTENMSQADHTQVDLNKLDHPYARRHGLEGAGIHEPYYQVHKQSGRLLSSKRSGIVEASISGGELKASAWCGVYERGAFYVSYVIYGTSRMIPRDFLTGSLNEIKDEATTYLKTNLRDFVFNFKGVNR